jgi:flagellar biosynthesis component FlhA
MLSRGYRGELLTIHPHQFVRSDVLVGVFSILILILIQIVGRLS